MKKPALLIDVDGVLCPFGADCPEGYSLVPLVAGEEHYNVSPQNGKRLARLAETFDLVWATGWEHRANEYLLEYHGLTPLPVIEFWKPTAGVKVKMDGFTIEDKRYKMAHWKLPWIDAWASETGRPLAWIDDEIDHGTIVWAESRTEAGIPTLALTIPYASGLDDSHVDTLEGWYGTFSNNGERD